MSEFVWELPASRPISVEESEPGEGAIDHAQAAIDRLPQQFKKPKTQALLRILCGPMAALEQAFVDLLTKRSVETAEGEQLNVLGRIVGQPQVNVTDTTFRSLIRARIRANKSSGMGNQVLLITRLVLTDYAAQDEVIDAGTLQIGLDPQYPATVVIRPNGVDLPCDLAQLLTETFLRRVGGAGIRFLLEFDVQEDPDFDAHDRVFTFDDATDVGSITAGRGFDDATNIGSEGGPLASVME